jgi:hypothetical protein
MIGIVSIVVVVVAVVVVILILLLLLLLLLLIIEVKLENKHCVPKSVETSHEDKVTILWNQQVQTNRTISEHAFGSSYK